MLRRGHQVLFALWLGLASSAAAVPLRLVSTSPQVTETLFQLGKGDALVATSHFSDYPDAAKTLPRIGPVFAAGIESLLKFSPTWVVSDAEASPITLEKGLEAASIPHLAMKVNSVAALFAESARLLKTIFGETTNATLENARTCAEQFRKSPPYSFLAFAWLSPPILFGHPTFLSDILTRTGGKNALPEGWQMAFPKVSPEWILKQNVTTIFYLTEMETTNQTAKQLAEQWWPGKTVRRVPLPAARFARGSFTPLKSIDEVVPETLPPGCAL